MTHFISENKKAIAVLVVAAVFIGIGAMRGEVDTVMSKAIAICLECIGIG